MSRHWDIESPAGRELLTEVNEVSDEVESDVKRVRCCYIKSIGQSRLEVPKYKLLVQVEEFMAVLFLSHCIPMMRVWSFRMFA